MCGEHFIISARGLGKTGSSPHVRGALSQLQCPCRWLGIIPACAGSTRTLRGFRTGRWDHPRMCGEHYVHRPQLDWDVGSSPHVRGARCFATVFLDGFGIIPACAGSTCPSRPSAATAGDHPRMCGEHRICCQSCKISTGSSPHVRGALVQDFLQGLSTGIIPACAGSTVSWRIRRPPCRDHPRMCGEHNRGSSFGQSHKGSSPHVRGARQACDDALQESGIIPACAGSTTVGKTKLLFIWDHPRMCGEHDTTCTRSPRDTGSSPHVRGAHSTRPSAHCRTGIIPACAGSTLKVSGRLRFAWDYPRMCGEHIVANRNCGSVQGSSPHVRGARAGRARPAGPSGIIPACAGSTLTPATSRCTSGDHPRMCGEHPASKDWNRKRVGSSPHVRGALW